MSSTRSLFPGQPGPDEDTAADAEAEPVWSDGPGSVARVAMNVPAPASAVYDYGIPAELRDRVAVGGRVKVALGRRRQDAFVVELAEQASVPASKIKFVEAVVDEEPVFDAAMLRLTHWMAEYYACNHGEVLTAALPAGVKKKPGRSGVTEVKLAIEREAAESLAAELATNEATVARSRVLQTLLTFDQSFTPSGLAKRLGISLSPIRTLRREGALTFERVQTADHLEGIDAEPTMPAALTDEQTTAVAAINAGLDARSFRHFLLQGVTGSGKTEVYIRAIQHCLEQGRSAIVLVPEIALTPQTVRRFKARVPAVAVFHSGLTDRQRRAQWMQVRRGETRVVIGPRSAIFAPVVDLGLIVVDEEHEASYKQNNTPRYHARDVAVQRVAMNHGVVVLGSATPSLESRTNAEQGKYQHLHLTQRVEQRPMPAVELIDMAIECREQKAFALLSRKLEDALYDCVVERGEQAILFLNRRGFHTFMQCTACGHVATCPNCDISLTYHRPLQRLVCHYCYETADATPDCPACRQRTLKYAGYGTQQIEELIRGKFPTFRVARMDSDTMTRPAAYEETLGEMRDGAIDVLIGTQMIGKGLDFPNVTLVGIISADGALNMPDFRARERTFQLIAQVAGRAGRGDRPGKVLVQTFHPEEPAVKLATNHDYEAFYRRELSDRSNAGYPPYCRVIQLTAEADDEADAEATLRSWAASLRDDTATAGTYHLLGPAPAVITKIRGKHRWQLLIKAPDSRGIQRITAVLRPLKPSSSKVRVTIDVDAIDMM